MIATACPLVVRDYQHAAIEAITESLREHRSTLAVLATGLGKTVIATEFARRFVSATGQRVKFLAHREELLHQAAAKFEDVGLSVGIEQADHYSPETGDFFGKPQVVVASVQTLTSDHRRARFIRDEFGLLIVDEAHHAVANSYRRILDDYRHARLLGITATPDRADEEALGQVFASVAYEMDVREGIADGWLADVRQEQVQVESLDFSRIKTTAGDLNGGQLDALMRSERPMHAVVSAVVQETARPTLIFASSVDHAHQMAQLINRHAPYQCAALDGSSDPVHRKRVLGDFASGKLRYLVNCALFTEGFDAPAVARVVMARPTKSRALYCQMLGRGTRPLPGIVDNPDLVTAGERRAAIAGSLKPDLHVMDFVGNSGRHKLMSAADALGGKVSDEIVERAKRLLAKRENQGRSVNELIEEAEQEERERLERLARDREHGRRFRESGLVATAKVHKQSVNPFDLWDVPQRREPGWHKGRQPTEKQAAALEKMGVPMEGMTFHKASQLLDAAFKRRDKGLCTYKQSKVLSRYGFDCQEMTMAEATKQIDAIAANGWKRP